MGLGCDRVVGFGGGVVIVLWGWGGGRVWGVGLGSDRVMGFMGCGGGSCYGVWGGVVLVLCARVMGFGGGSVWGYFEGRVWGLGSCMGFGVVYRVWGGHVLGYFGGVYTPKVLIL